MPPLLVLFATLFVGAEGTLRDLGPMGFVPGLLFVSILLWTCFRFGLLAGIIFTLSSAVLSLANEYLAVEPASFRILGGAFLLLWLVSAGISLNALFKRHPWAGESPATPPVRR